MADPLQHFLCWEHGMLPTHGCEMMAPTPARVAERYVSAHFEGEEDGCRTVFVRPLAGGPDLKFIVEVATETTFAARLAEGVSP